MAVTDIKTRKKYDKKKRTLHVYATSIPVFVGAPTVMGDKSADLDEIFGRKKDDCQGQVQGTDAADGADEEGGEQDGD